MTLTVATPNLSAEGVSGPLIPAEKPITLTCSEVTLPGGTVVLAETAERFGYLVYRQQGDGTVQAWDEASQLWVGDASGLEPGALPYLDGRWQAIIVAIGQKDASGQDKFMTDVVSGYPQYYARCLFAANDAAGNLHEGISANSPAVQIVAAGSDNKAGLAIDPEEPTEATEVKVFLKDSGLIERGTITIREQGSGYAISLVASGARIEIRENGDIELAPAGGGSVQIDGDLVVRDTLTVGGFVLP